MRNKQLLALVKTAMLLALTIAVQTLVRDFIPIPAPFNQLVIGTFVNLFLVLAVLYCGPAWSLAVAAAAPVVAFMQGQITNPVQIVIVAVGNCIILVPFIAVILKSRGKSISPAVFAVASLTGAVLKFAALYVGMLKIFYPLFVVGVEPEAKAQKMLETMNLSFTWPQLVTASAGCLIAFVIYNALNRSRALEKNF